MQKIHYSHVCNHIIYIPKSILNSTAVSVLISHLLNWCKKEVNSDLVKAAVNDVSCYSSSIERHMIVVGNN